jgi:hypothetical protein
LTQYLIRKRNQFGHIVHVDTVPGPPTPQSLVQQYGFGLFNIVTAEDGVKGLKPFATWVLGPHVEFVQWVPHETEAARYPKALIDPQTYPVGDYYVVQVSRAEPVVVHASGDAEAAKQRVQELTLAAPALQGYIIFRIVAGSPGGMKQCPTCQTFMHLDSEVCTSCGHGFVVPEG